MNRTYTAATAVKLRPAGRRHEAGAGLGRDAPVTAPPAGTG